MESAESVGIQLAENLGIKNGPEVLAELRAKSPEEIMNATPSTSFFDGLVDGYVIREQPAVVFATGRQAAVPLLTGSTVDESAMFASQAPKTITEYKHSLEEDFHEDWKTIFDAYPAKSDAETSAVWREMYTDYLFGASVYAMARAQKNTGQPAYFYYFTYKSPNSLAYGGSAYHCIELFYLSGVFYKPYWSEPNAEDLQLAATMRGYWERFAKTGDPNSTGFPNWAAYSAATHPVLEFGSTVRLSDVPHLDRYKVFERVLEKKLRNRTTAGH